MLTNTAYTRASSDSLRQELSKIPLKELTIRLVKVESGSRQTFIASEIEQKSMPLNAINISNNAAEVIRACK